MRRELAGACPLCGHDPIGIAAAAQGTIQPGEGKLTPAHRRELDFVDDNLRSLGYDPDAMVAPAQLYISPASKRAAAAPVRQQPTVPAFTGAESTDYDTVSEEQPTDLDYLE